MILETAQHRKLLTRTNAYLAERKFRGGTLDASADPGERSIDIAAAGREGPVARPVQGRNLFEIDLARVQLDVPAAAIAASIEQLRRADAQLPAQRFWKRDHAFEGEPLFLALYTQATDLECLRFLVARQDQGQGHLFGDHFDITHVPARPGLLDRQVFQGNTLYPPFAIRQLAHFEVGVTNHDTIDDQRPVGDEARKRNAYAHLLRRNDARQWRATGQLGIIKLELRTAQAPAGIHAGEIHLHTDG